MSGATIIIPKNPHPFISPNLISSDLPHVLVDCNADAIALTISESIKTDVDHRANHARLSQGHGWHVAADNIARELRESITATQTTLHEHDR